MDSQLLRRLIQARLFAGRLPRTGVLRVWGGIGAGETCDACGKVTRRADFIFGGTSTSEGNPEIRMHADCFAVWEEERKAERTAPDCMTAVDKIREKIAAGKLPIEDAPKRWAGPGDGGLCDACDFSITDLQYEFDSVEGRVFRFHRLCMVAWDEIRQEHA